MMVCDIGTFLRGAAPAGNAASLRTSHGAAAAGSKIGKRLHTIRREGSKKAVHGILLGNPSKPAYPTNHNIWYGVNLELSRFSKSDWLKLAVRLLGEEGPAAMTVERLTEAAGRTRGSLYHHFQSREGVLVALMDWWRLQAIEGRNERFMAVSGDDALRDFMRAEPLLWDTRFERGVRQLAVTEPTVAATLKEIDEARIAGVAAVIARLRPEVDDPQSLAFIQYAVVVGLQWLVSPGDPRWNAVAAAGYNLFGLSRSEGD